MEKKMYIVPLAHFPAPSSDRNANAVLEKLNNQIPISHGEKIDAAGCELICNEH